MLTFRILAIGLVFLLACASVRGEPIIFEERDLFEAMLENTLIDDYTDPGYDAGFLTDEEMSAVFGETKYRATAFPDFNFVQSAPWVNMNFYTAVGSCELSFSATEKVGNGQGVDGFGVTFITNFSSDGDFNSPGWIVTLTLADGSTWDYVTPTVNGEIGPRFWGVISPHSVIVDLHIGGPNGSVWSTGSYQLGMLTLGDLPREELLFSNGFEANSE